MNRQRLIEDTAKDYHINVCNEAQEDMANKFGWFTMMFLFWLPKYGRWYQNRIKEIKTSLKESEKQSKASRGQNVR